MFKKKKQVGAVIGLIFFNPVSNQSKFFIPQQFENEQISVLNQSAVQFVPKIISDQCLAVIGTRDNYLREFPLSFERLSLPALPMGQKVYTAVQNLTGAYASPTSPTLWIPSLHYKGY